MGFYTKQGHMTREELEKHLEAEMTINIRKCKNTKIRFLQMYRLGNLYVQSEVYRRLTGKTFDISKGYFYT